MRINGLQIDSLIRIVREKTGMDLAGYRRSTLSRRISERLARLGMDADQYLHICLDNEEECRELVNAIAINVSSFFRDPAMFEVMAQSVLPQMIERKTGELRVWSAGCAAGEEAYSVAMLISMELKKVKNDRIKPIIFATDIDRDVLKEAEKAFYYRESLVDVKLGMVDDFFSPVRDGFQVTSEVRKMIHFSFDDLLSEQTAVPAKSIYGSFDIVLCRNVLIYFSPAHQRQVFLKLYESLSRGGYLVLGNSGALCREVKSRFKTVDKRNKIYQK